MLVFNITHGLMHATPKFSKVYYKIETQIKDGDPECFFLCPTLVAILKTSFSISLPSLKLTISLFYLRNMTLLTLLILKVCRAHVIYGLCSGSCSP